MLGFSPCIGGLNKCVTDYILFWARLDKVPRTMIVIEKLNVLNNGLKKNNNKSFILLFVASQFPWTNKFMKSKFICKEALGTFLGYGHIALKALVSHAKNHTLPIHRLTGRVDPVSTKFEENILPPLAYFFKNKIVPFVGARPTCYTPDAVWQTTIERDTNNILELDPGVSERGLYCKYIFAWVEN